MGVSTFQSLYSVRHSSMNIATYEGSECPNRGTMEVLAGLGFTVGFSSGFWIPVGSKMASTRF